MQRDKISDAKIIKAFIKNRGIIGATAATLKVDRSTLYKWMDDTPALKTAQQDARSSFVDKAESKLADNVDAGDMKAIIYTLNTLGRDRGYGQRIIISDKSDLEEAIDNASDAEILQMIQEKNRRIADAAKGTQ